jgi:hypothetical protein
MKQYWNGIHSKYLIIYDGIKHENAETQLVILKTALKLIKWLHLTILGFL